MLVSHDFRLISQVADEIWEVKDHSVIKLSMTIEEYKDSLKKDSAMTVEKAVAKAKS